MNPNELNNFLSQRSYTTGFSYSYADLTLFNKIKDRFEDYQKLEHVLRWFQHIKVLSMKQNLVLPDKKCSTYKSMETGSYNIYNYMMQCEITVYVYVYYVCGSALNFM